VPYVAGPEAKESGGLSGAAAAWRPSLLTKLLTNRITHAGPCTYRGGLASLAESGRQGRCTGHVQEKYLVEISQEEDKPKVTPVMHMPCN
jgi:hypothetical protein